MTKSGLLRICQGQIPFEPNPVIRIHSKSEIIIIGHSPGIKVHRSSIPWNDRSGDNLRKWKGLDTQEFYNVEKVSIVPIGFCYPGKGKSGDLPPMKICAPTWYKRILTDLLNLRLTLLIGQYAQRYYLGKNARKNLTETVTNYEVYLPDYFVLPHPSPRNIGWMQRNPWFEKHLVPKLKIKVKEAQG